MDIDVPEFLILVLVCFALVYAGIHLVGRRRKGG